MAPLGGLWAEEPYSLQSILFFAKIDYFKFNNKKQTINIIKSVYGNFLCAEMFLSIVFFIMILIIPVFNGENENSKNNDK